MNAVAEKPAVTKYLDFITAANHSWLYGAVQKRWEQGGVGRGLRFSQSGVMRLGQVFGWIEGISHTNKNFAVELARDFITQLDHFSTYGGWADDPEGTKKLHYVPKYITEFHDDSSIGGFGVASYIAIDWGDIVNRYDWYNRDQGNRKALCDALKIYRFQEEHGRSPVIEPSFSPVGEKRWCYTYSWNGGFVYNGPGADQTFTVQLTPGRRFWTMNT